MTNEEFIARYFKRKEHDDAEGSANDATCELESAEIVDVPLNCSDYDSETE